MPSTSRFKRRDGPYLQALLDYVMVSPRLRDLGPDWQIWHPFDHPECYENRPLREALLTASDHFPVVMKLPVLFCKPTSRPYIACMKQIITATFIAALAVSPLAAQEADDPSVSEGFSLMEEGAKLLLRGLMNEMEPALDDMSEAMIQLGAEMGPAFTMLLSQIDDLRNYDAPEVLPNGDIIMRRRDEAPTYEPDPETGEVDL